MRQVRLHGPQDLRIDEVPMPVAGPGEVVVKVAMFGICGSDLGFARAGYIGRQSPQPMPLGHELVGTIHQLGSDVSGLYIGQRVVVHPMHGSNRIGTGDPVHGGFAEYLLVREAVIGKSLFEIPENMSFERAVLTEPLAVGMHGLNLGEARADDRVTVFGAGPIGLGVIAALKHRGVQRIVAVDVIDSRLERAQQLGAEQVINPTRDDLPAALAEYFGKVRGSVTGQPLIDCSLYIDCAGHATLLQQTVALARDKARIVVLATHKQPVELDMVQLMIKELSLLGSLSYPDEFPEVLLMLSDDKLSVAPLLSHQFTFEAFADAFAAAQQAGDSAKVVVRLD